MNTKLTLMMIGGVVPVFVHVEVNTHNGSKAKISSDNIEKVYSDVVNRRTRNTIPENGL